jgi:hypothetical protein
MKIDSLHTLSFADRPAATIAEAARQVHPALNRPHSEGPHFQKDRFDAASALLIPAIPERAKTS